MKIRNNKITKELFGSLKRLKIDSQKMKNELRKEWNQMVSFYSISYVK